MSEYLKVEIADHQAKVIEEMRLKLSEKFGVTVVGQFVTVRWGKKLKQVTMVVTDVDTGEDRTFGEIAGSAFGDVFEPGEADVHNS